MVMIIPVEQIHNDTGIFAIIFIPSLKTASHELAYILQIKKDGTELPAYATTMRCCGDNQL